MGRNLQPDHTLVTREKEVHGVDAVADDWITLWNGDADRILDPLHRIHQELIVGLGGLRGSPASGGIAIDDDLRAMARIAVLELPAEHVDRAGVEADFVNDPVDTGAAEAGLNLLAHQTDQGLDVGVERQ